MLGIKIFCPWLFTNAANNISEEINIYIYKINAIII